MSTKKKYQPKSFESKCYLENGKTDTSANIYLSMLLSYAWSKLSSKQQILYVYMKAEYYGTKTSKHPKNNNDYFYFNQHIWKNELKLYTNNSQFYKDMNKLAEYGFIEIVERSPNTRTKTIYKYSDKWKTYNE